MNGGSMACTSARAVRNWKKSEASRYRQLVKRSLENVKDEQTADETLAVMSPLKEAGDPYGPRDGHGFRGTARQAEIFGWKDAYDKEMRKK